MESTQPFEGEDFALTKGFGGLEQRFMPAGYQVPSVVPQFQERTALWAGIRLGVKASVRRVVVLSSASLTHLKHLHTCVVAIVRKGFDDCESRSAVGTVGKRIKIAPIAWIKDLIDTV